MYSFVRVFFLVIAGKCYGTLLNPQYNTMRAQRGYLFTVLIWRVGQYSLMIGCCLILCSFGSVDMATDDSVNNPLGYSVNTTLKKNVEFCILYALFRLVMDLGENNVRKSNWSATQT